MSREHCRESQTKVNSIEDPKFLSEYYAVNRMGRKTIAWICPLCQEYQQMPLLEHRKNCWACPRCQKNQRGFKNDHKRNVSSANAAINYKNVQQRNIIRSVH